jgi:hypothetical protein
MHHLTWSDAGLVLLFCVAAFIGWRVAVWLATGKMRLYGSAHGRRYTTMMANPVRYWTNLTVYAAIVVLLAVLCGSAWLDLVRRLAE